MNNLFIHDITIERKAMHINDDGSFTEEYQIIGTAKARVTPASIRVREFYQAGQEKVNVSHVIYTEFWNVQAGDIILFQEQQFKVIAVRNPSYMNHHLEIDCELIQ